MPGRKSKGTMLLLRVFWLRGFWSFDLDLSCRTAPDSHRSFPAMQQLSYPQNPLEGDRGTSNVTLVRSSEFGIRNSELGDGETRKMEKASPPIHCQLSMTLPRPPYYCVNLVLRNRFSPRLPISESPRLNLSLISKLTEYYLLGGQSIWICQVG